MEVIRVFLNLVHHVVELGLHGTAVLLGGKGNGGGGRAVRGLRQCHKGKTGNGSSNHLGEVGHGAVT